MNTQTPQSSLRAATWRVEEGLDALRIGQGPDAARHLLYRYCSDGRRYVNWARRDQSGGEPEVCVEWNASLDPWDDLSRHDASKGKAQFFVSYAMDARNSATHLARRGPSFWSVQPESRPRMSGGFPVLRVVRRYA